MNLTDRQVKKIEFVLGYKCMKEYSVNHKIIIFNGKEYMFYPDDYKKVCEIIDCIKGVKK